jgi:hypothetical protein
MVKLRGMQRDITACYVEFTVTRNLWKLLCCIGCMRELFIYSNLRMQKSDVMLKLDS